MSTCPSMTRFDLLRHAETVWNREKRIQGQSDSPLTPKGKEQAGQWGRVLKTDRYDRILVSDAGRALKTAELINTYLQIPIHRDSRLKEQHWGLWTEKKLTMLEMEFTRRLMEQEQKGWAFCPPGGEDRNMVFERSQRALTEAAEKWPGLKILVITHEGVIKCLIYRYYRRKFLPTERPLLRPLHLHRLVHDAGEVKVEAINALSIL